MAIHHALLSLLEEGESYGYELRAEFERTVGPQFGALNIGHVYQLLERLKRDGLVEVVRTEPQPRRTERVIYAITDAGWAELQRWLGSPTPSAGYRDDLFLKLSAAARLGCDTLLAVVGSERSALFGELHALRGFAAQRPEPLVGLLIDGATLQVQARLALLDRAEQDAEVLVTPRAHEHRAQQATDSAGRPAASDAA